MLEALEAWHISRNFHFYELHRVPIFVKMVTIIAKYYDFETKT